MNPTETARVSRAAAQTTRRQRSTAAFPLPPFLSADWLQEHWKLTNADRRECLLRLGDRLGLSAQDKPDEAAFFAALHRVAAEDYTVFDEVGDALIGNKRVDHKSLPYFVIWKRDPSIPHPDNKDGVFEASVERLATLLREDSGAAWVAFACVRAYRGVVKRVLCEDEGLREQIGGAVTAIEERFSAEEMAEAWKAFSYQIWCFSELANTGVKDDLDRFEALHDELRVFTKKLRDREHMEWFQDVEDICVRFEEELGESESGLVARFAKVAEDLIKAGMNGAPQNDDFYDSFCDDLEKFLDIRKRSAEIESEIAKIGETLQNAPGKATTEVIDRLQRAQARRNELEDPLAVAEEAVRRVEDAVKSMARLRIVPDAEPERGGPGSEAAGQAQQAEQTEQAEPTEQAGEGSADQDDEMSRLRLQIAEWRERAESAERESAGLHMRLTALERSGGKAAAVTSALPETMDAVGEWALRNLTGRLFLSPKAERKMRESVFERPSLVAEALSLLAYEYRDMRLSRDGGDGAFERFNERCSELRLERVKHKPQGTKPRRSDAFTVFYNGRRLETLDHLKNKGSSRDPQHCLRVYFAWDEDTEQVIVGSLPGHLPTRIS